MSRELESFRHFIANRGGKLTSERKAVIAAICSLHDHFCAEELLDRIKARGDKVSRASVYRSLQLFVKSNLLRKLDFGENRHYYERHFETHHHLVCTRCGHVIEFTAEPMKNLAEELWKRYRFNAAEAPQKILGLCYDCSHKHGERVFHDD